MRTSSKHQVKVKTTPSISRGGGCISQNNTPTAFTDNDEVSRNYTNSAIITDVCACRVSTHMRVCSESIVWDFLGRPTECFNPYAGV